MTIIDLLWTNKHILNQFYIYHKCRFIGNKARHTQTHSSTTTIDFLGTNEHILHQFTSITRVAFLGAKIRDPQSIYIYNNPRFLRNKWTHPQSVYMLGKHRFLWGTKKNTSSIGLDQDHEGIPSLPHHLAPSLPPYLPTYLPTYPFCHQQFCYIQSQTFYLFIFLKKIMGGNGLDSWNLPKL
jgi:hypothetical protein